MAQRNRSNERDHLSIGEVLSLLQEEFPDVTISKIRFLESQGLLDPERTPSGYRKFYEPDIDQLRWILRQQKDNFLPLKVIKDRLASGNLESDEDGRGSEGDLNAALPEPNPQLDLAGIGSSVSMSVDELGASSGLSSGQITELERYGLISSHRLGPDRFYDEDALEVARMAARFAAHGVEPRLLRMFKVSAEREAGFYEQLLLPRLRQRRSGIHDEVQKDLDDLVGLADDLHGALLRRLLRDSFHSR